MSSIGVPFPIAGGTLPTTTGDLFTSPASRLVRVDSITIVNNDTVARTINLLLKRSGATAQRIAPKNLSLGAGAMFQRGPLALGGGDVIQGDASVAGQLDFSIQADIF